MRPCPNCDKPIKAGARFCPHCGKPVGPAPYAAPMPAGAPAKPANGGTKKKWMIAGGIVLGVILCCILVAGVAAFVYFDPFGWFGGTDPLAKAAPANTDLYFSANLLKLQETATRELVDTFASNSGNPDVENTEDMLDELDEELAAMYGVTVTEDIIPWVGQYVSVAILDITDAGTQVLVLAQVRDKKAADAFMANFMAGTEDITGDEFETLEYQGVSIYELNTDYDYQRVAIARANNVIFFAPTADIIEAGIDAQKGDSLSAGNEYRTILRQLPKDRLVTMYIPESGIQNLSDELNGSSGMGFDVDLGYLRDVAAALSVDSDSLHVDMITGYNPDEMTDAQRQVLEAYSSNNRMAAMFPAETVMFSSGTRLDLVWAAYRDMIVGALGAEDFDEAMDSFENEIGFNLDTDLFPVLDGQYAVGVVNDPDSYLNAEDLAGVPLGILAFFESSDIAAVGGMVDDLASTLENSGGMILNHDTSGALDMYVITDYYTEMEVFAFGTRDSYLVLGTNPDLMEGVSGTTLEGTPAYSELWRRFDSGMFPVLFVNFSAGLDLLTALDTYGEYDALEPIVAGGIAASGLTNNTTHTQMIIVVQK